VYKSETDYCFCINTYKAWNNYVDLRHYLSLYLINNAFLKKDLSVSFKGNKELYLRGTIIIVLKLLYSVAEAGTY
jgi:hypothetical protein